ncbi:MAG: hypothetical protein P8H59_13085 [Flavobacteriales bacterium]|nr:hypothetical protein [Flavobacteriales bacterium]MDG1781886.1 hypothetical protein [Flavobacteriales bacterium]
MKLLTLSLACLLSILSLQMNGQKERTVDSLNHSIGLHVGSTSGYGLSYRYRPNRLGVQLSFTPYKNTDRTVLVSGLSFMYVLSEYRDINFFLYQVCPSPLI